MPHFFSNSSDSFQLFTTQSSLEQFYTAIPQLSIQEISEVFTLLQNNPSVKPEEKLEALFETLETTEKLENLGKNLSVPHFLDILNFLVRHPPLQNHLSAILVGLEPPIFCEALNYFQTEQLSIFKNISLLEPLQYHLTQFVHEGETLTREIGLQIEEYTAKLSSIKPQELEAANLDNLIFQIDGFRNLLLDYLERASAALSIAWNTERIDLIEKLSSLNEGVQHLLTNFVGHPSSDHLPASGLYATTGNTLSKIFNSSLKDEDAAVEGLTRLSIWHLKDYWELGLLPQIRQMKEVEIDPQASQENQQSARFLFSQVQKQLETLRIGTVGDLKREQLFSKPLLIAYIERNRDLLMI